MRLMIGDERDRDDEHVIGIGIGNHSQGKDSYSRPVMCRKWDSRPTVGLEAKSWWPCVACALR